MGTPGSSSDASREAVRAAVAERDDPFAPFGAAEVAQRLNCSERAARRTLDALADRGELRIKEIGGTRVWWRPGDADDGSTSQEFRAFVNAVEDYAIFMLDPDGVVASWNEGAERIKGYAADEIVGQHFSTFYTEDDRAAGVPERNLQRAEEAGRTEDEGWRVRADGTRFWAKVTITAVRDDDGELQGFTKVTRDMTERREYEQELRRERDLIERIFEIAPIGMCVIEPDGELLRANARLLARHGIQEHDVEGYNLTSRTLYDADDDPIPPEEWPFARVAETGEPVHGFECQRERPDGERRWVSINAVPLDDADGDRIVAAVEDVTERKVREAELRREAEQTRQLVRTAPVALAVQNADGETVMANQRAQMILGLSEREISESPADSDAWGLTDPDGEPVPPSETPMARARATGESVFNEELIIEPPDGEPVHVRMNAAPLFGSDGDVDRVVVAGEDITELKRRERQLERRKTELETELSEMLERIDDSFFALDDEWRFAHVNDSAVELFRKPRDELLGREAWTAFPDRPDDVYRDHLERAMDTQEPVTFEVREPAIDAWLEFNVYPSETGLSVYFRDVTERRESQRRLEESEWRYRTLAESFPDGVVTLFDHDGTYELAAGQGFERISLAPEDLEGRSFREVWDEDTLETVEQAFEAALDGEARSVELTYEGRDWLFHAVPITDAGGDVFAGMTMAQDITERKERERELQRYREYTDDVLDAIDDLFYLVDEDGRLQRWNESIAALAGLDDDQIDGMRVAEFFDGADREAIAEAIDEGFERGHVQVEAAVRGRDGRQIPYEFVASTLEDPADNVVLAGIGRDISDRVEYERKLKESNERLEQFAYAASHDLREPLRMISSYLQLVDKRYADALDDDGREFIDYAVDGADRMREMIEGLLAYSRIETQGEPFEPVDLDDVLADVRNDLQLHIEETDAEIVADPLPTVRGDAGQLRQVFQNLLDNAMEYSGEDPPHVEISAQRDGDQWVLSVSDDGIGIDPGDADRVFEVFQRLHARDEHDGTGIGLALCRRIVERHGGDIWVESDGDGGSTFYFTLPASDGD